MSGSLLPTNYLGAIQGYRPLQTAPIGLIIAPPQLVLGSVVALFLYQKWVDSRVVFAVGLALIAPWRVFPGSQLTSQLNRGSVCGHATFAGYWSAVAVVAILFLATSVVHPTRSLFFRHHQHVSGARHTHRRRRDRAIAGRAWPISCGNAAGPYRPGEQCAPAGTRTSLLLMTIIGQQSLVLSVADAYRVLGLLALLLIPLVHG